MRVLSATPGKVLASMEVQSHQVNRLATLHGGLTSSLVDAMGSLAVNSTGLYMSGVSTDIHVSSVAPLPLWPGPHKSKAARRALLTATRLYRFCRGAPLGETVNLKSEVVAQGASSSSVGGARSCDGPLLTAPPAPVLSLSTRPDARLHPGRDDKRKNGQAPRIRVAHESNRRHARARREQEVHRRWRDRGAAQGQGAMISEHFSQDQNQVKGRAVICASGAECCRGRSTRSFRLPPLRRRRGSRSCRPCL